MTTTSTPSLDAALAELEAELGMLAVDDTDEPKIEVDALKEKKVDDGASVLDSLDELLELDLSTLSDAEAVVIDGGAVEEKTEQEVKMEVEFEAEEIDELDSELAELEKELGSEQVPDEPVTDEVAIDEAAAALELLEGLSEEDEMEAAVTSELEEAHEPSAAADDEEPGEATEAPSKPRGKARACGTTNPFDALIVRLGGVSAVSANVVLTMADTERPSEVLREEFKEIVNSMAKKVGEKAVNLMAHLQGTASLSVYTSTALEMLFEKGTLTSKELFDRYMSRPYSEGTSRSQSGQLMQLLVGLKIAQRDGKGVKLNPDSVLAAALESRLKDAA